MPGTLSVAAADGSNQRQLLEMKALELVIPSWSPDGRRITFGLIKRASQEWSAWEISADGTGLRRLFPDWQHNPLPVGWRPDGRVFVLMSQFQLWAARQPSRWLPAVRPPLSQLTSGETQFFAPVQFRDNHTFYAVGNTPLGELERLDLGSKTWVPHLGGLSAASVEYSRDGQRVVYVTHPGREMWVRFADGSRPVQLTKPPMVSWITRWSPDDRLIAFMGKSTAEEPWRTYLVDSTGGTPRLACGKEVGPQGDLSWAPDGKRIVYDAPSNQFYSGEGVYLRVLNLETCELTKFPGSDGLFSPRWSPDGSTLAALPGTYTSPEGRPFMLYHFSTGKWEEVMRPGFPNWPSWSHDGTSLWYWDLLKSTITRFDLRTHRHEDVAPLRAEEMTGTEISSWFALTPNDEPMILRRRDIQQIYALEWKSR